MENVQPYNPFIQESAIDTTDSEINQNIAEFFTSGVDRGKITQKPQEIKEVLLPVKGRLIGIGHLNNSEEIVKSPTVPPSVETTIAEKSESIMDNFIESVPYKKEEFQTETKSEFNDEKKEPASFSTFIPDAESPEDIEKQEKKVLWGILQSYKLSGMELSEHFTVSHSIQALRDEVNLQKTIMARVEGRHKMENILVQAGKGVTMVNGLLGNYINGIYFEEHWEKTIKEHPETIEALWRKYLAPKSGRFGPEYELAKCFAMLLVNSAIQGKAGEIVTAAAHTWMTKKNPPKTNVPNKKRFVPS